MWMYGGCCRSTNSCAINDSEILTSEVEYCRSCEPQESWVSLECSMMKSSTLFERGPLPPYFHIVSTRRHSRDRCSQAFPVFRTLPLPCIILNANRRTKNGGGLGTRLYNHSLALYESSYSVIMTVNSAVSFTYPITIFTVEVSSLLNEEFHGV